jgi:cytochrome c peroxidase
MKIYQLSFVFAAILLLSSCIHDKVDVDVKYYTAEEYSVLQAALDLPESVDEYNFALSRGAAPAISNTKATLGRVLFYDTQLSRNNTVSCASCHKQELAFSDNKARSTGFDGGLTKRNSLALGAVANFETSYDGGNSFVGNGNGTNIGFLWDERAQSIHELSTIAITDPVEMGTNMSELPGKLASQAHYEILFRKAYGDNQIKAERITEALQEFVNSFVSVNSKFDKGIEKNFVPTVNFTNFTPVENLGKALFMTNCSSCHGQDMTNPAMRIANNGLELNYEDKGVGGVSNRNDEMGLFKVPFLRNVALTAPYMHDGRFATLEAVVEHYNSGVQMHPNLHPLLTQPLNPNQPRRLNLSQQEKAALVAFLHTLTDEQFTQETRFSDPFK